MSVNVFSSESETDNDYESNSGNYSEQSADELPCLEKESSDETRKCLCNSVSK